MDEDLRGDDGEATGGEVGSTSSDAFLIGFGDSGGHGDGGGDDDGASCNGGGGYPLRPQPSDREAAAAPLVAFAWTTTTPIASGATEADEAAEEGSPSSISSESASPRLKKSHPHSHGVRGVASSRATSPTSAHTTSTLVSKSVHSRLWSLLPVSSPLPPSVHLLSLARAPPSVISAARGGRGGGGEDGATTALAVRLQRLPAPFPDDPGANGEVVAVDLQALFPWLSVLDREKVVLTSADFLQELAPRNQETADEVTSSSTTAFSLLPGDELSCLVYL